MPKVTTFVFGAGLHQENDDRMQSAGNPRTVRNLVRTKNGRLEVRKDYETVGMTGTGSTGAGTGALTNLRLYDLAEFNGRLLGFGRADFNTRIDYSIDAAEDVFELIERPTGNWRRALASEIGQGSRARLIGRIGRKASSIVTMDIAAANGLVCLVYDIQPRAPGISTISCGVHVFDAATDTTVFSAAISAGDRPRVVAVDGVFFIGYVQTSNGAIGLRRFNPASDTSLVTLTTPVAAGASVNGWDMAKSASENTFWMAVARSDATTALRGLSSAGAVTYTTAGPTVEYDAISVFHERFNGNASRLTVAGVVLSSGDTDLYSYLPPATTPNATDLNAFTSRAQSQVGLSQAQTLGTTSLAAYFTEDGAGTLVTTAIWQLNLATLASSLYRTGVGDRAVSKPISIDGRAILNSIVEEDTGFFTHVVGLMGNGLNAVGTRPVCAFDRFLGHELTQTHLPQIAYDSSTGLAYIAVGTEDSDRFCCPQVLEIKIAGTDRRQTVQLGDCLYIAGGIVQAYDGRMMQEAGGFVTRPFTRISVSLAGGGGNLDNPGTYQSVPVMEYRDAKHRRIQSAPGNLEETELVSTDDQIQVTIKPSVSFRDTGNNDTTTPLELQSAPTLTVYRTLNIDDGNGTFHQDLSIPIPNLSIRSQVTDILEQSDTDISDNEIIYSQGARGALSGPLEFVCPDAAMSLAASSDRVLTGQLINDTQIQESRPLFPGEQVQWSDTLGFYRDVRNQILAVARLDERRLIFSAAEIFECDGPGLDDNGVGDIGPPRKLPSDVGLYGGILGWRSMVEMSAGVMFQGLKSQIYLMPRGGVTPQPVGTAVEDTLEAYPVISAAVYIAEDQTVRFCCNNESGTESVVLLFDVRFVEWFLEGPYDFTIRSAAKLNGRFMMLTSDNTLLRQLVSHPPATFIDNDWGSGIVHPAGVGMEARVLGIRCVGTVRSDCRITCVIHWIDEDETETLETVNVFERPAGSQFVYRWEPKRTKCEAFDVRWEVRDLQGRAGEGLQLNYWQVEFDPIGLPAYLSPDQMS